MKQLNRPEHCELALRQWVAPVGEGVYPPHVQAGPGAPGRTRRQPATPARQIGPPRGALRAPVVVRPLPEPAQTSLDRRAAIPERTPVGVRVRIRGRGWAEAVGSSVAVVEPDATPAHRRKQTGINMCKWSEAVVLWASPAPHRAASAATDPAALAEASGLVRLPGTLAGGWAFTDGWLRRLR